MRVNGREKREAIVESLRINFQLVFCQLDFVGLLEYKAALCTGKGLLGTKDNKKNSR